MTRSTILLAATMLAALAGCDAPPADSGAPIVVSMAGAVPRAAPDPNRTALSAPEAALLAATAQGLVRFDGGGQIEPGLAARWDVSDDGLFYTFRLRDGTGIGAERVARRLRTAIAAASRNPLRPILLAIDEVVAVTPEVVELRLTAPRPNLLQLLAQPELALRGPATGGGPMRVVDRQGGVVRLRPLADPAIAETPPPGDEVRLRAERTAIGLARYASGAAQVVTGGTFATLPLARAAAPRRRELRFDAAPGLLGFEIVRADGILADPEARRALAMAIDRDRIVAAFGGEGWRPALALLPPGTELTTPAAPAWAAVPLAERAAAAGAIIAGSPAPPGVLRVAMPKGAGARLLFALVAIDWKHIGVAAEAVPWDAPADLRLVDQVAPGDVTTWYLRRFACVRSAVCSAVADEALEAARITPSIPDRLRLLQAANVALEQAVPFVPLATPLRWSLVSPAVPGWHDNPRAVHPLYALRRGD